VERDHRRAPRAGDAAREQAAAARREAGDAERVLAAALDRDRRRSSAQGAKLHELRKYVELEVEGSGAATLYLEYQVEAARWSPSYAARFEGERVTLEVRAMIAQDTGEDWTGVALRLSTAEPERSGGLPELAAQRIGRRQPEPARAGFRAPPTGAAALYLDYLRAFPDAARAAQSGTADGEDTARVRPAALLDRDAVTLQEDADELMTLVDDAPTPARAFFKSIAVPGAAPGAMPPPPAPMAATGAMRLALPAMPKMRAKTASARAAYDLAPPEQSAAAEPPPPPVRLDYTNLRMAPPSSRERGALVAASPDGEARTRIRSSLAAATARVLSLALPAGCSARWSHTYDYAFAADGAVDVLSDGAWHSIAVTAKSTTAKLRHVAVPREQADVFRLAVFANPLAGPVLPGPIDIYDRGRFLITSEVDHTPPGAPVEIGLGVDAAVKLSRNTEFREETTGVLRGGLRLHHAIRIDVDNLSERAIDLEVRERLPVTRDDDDDVEVVAGRVEPAWERFSPDASAPHEPRLRGGYRWRLAVPAGGKRALRAAYEVRIAGKHELAGGNRRES